MKTFYIYKLTCVVNGKGYIGFTENIKRRMRQHKYTATKGYGQTIHAAIRKYGWETFVVEELYQSDDRQETLNHEAYFIDLHETKGSKGYNITRGGMSKEPRQSSEALKQQRIEAGRKLGKSKLGTKTSDEARANMSAAHVGAKHSPEHTEKIRLANKGQVPWIKGKTHSPEARAKIGAASRACSPETRRKLSEAAKGKRHTEESRLKMSLNNKGRAPWNKGLKLT
jgi:group I intron endonuclease